MSHALPAGSPLRGPVLLAAFEGWNDAGSAASLALAHLVSQWETLEVDELDPEEYHDFQVNRPQSAIGSDGRREISWPTTTITVAAHPNGHKVVLVQGIEPSMRWRRYATEVLDAAERLGVRTIVTLGALLADVPHTRPIPITATTDDPDLQQFHGLDSSTYEGPTGIVGVIQDEARRRGFTSVSLWAAVPHYVAHPPSPKASLALLTRLEELWGESIAMGDLPEDADAWKTGVDELAAEDSEIAEYVSQLEEAKDTVDLPEATGEAIAREFERYLRRRDAPGA